MGLESLSDLKVMRTIPLGLVLLSVASGAYGFPAGNACIAPSVDSRQPAPVNAFSRVLSAISGRLRRDNGQSLCQYGQAGPVGPRVQGPPDNTSTFHQWQDSGVGWALRARTDGSRFEPGSGSTE